MSKRKGELSDATIDRKWPHQVALPGDLCVMANFRILHEFCRGLSVSPRGRSVTAEWSNHKAETFRLFCFADRADSEAFAAQFGGVHFDPKRDRGRGKLRNQWRRSDEYVRVLELGPLRVPDILRN